MSAVPDPIAAALWFFAAWTAAYLFAASTTWARNRMRMIPEATTSADWMKATLAWFAIGVAASLAFGLGFAALQRMRGAIGDRGVTVISFLVVAAVLVLAFTTRRRRIQ